MPEINAQEIAQKLNITVEQVNNSDAIKSTYYEIKNNPSLTEEDKEEAYQEMASICKGMIQGNPS